MNREQLTSVLGVWSRGKGPLYQQLADALQLAIVNTEIPAQTRLPAERLLAQWLGISRSTVVAAFRVLAEGGWVVGRHGSGTWVNALKQQRSTQQRNAQLQPLARSPIYDAFLSEQVTQIDLATGAVPWPEGSTAAAYLPTGAEIATLGSEYGYLLQGYFPLRRAIAQAYEQQGVPTTPEEIVITTGAQQAITLISSCFLQRGDPLLIESPTFFGAIDAFRSQGLRLRSVPVTCDGLDVERLQQRMRAGTAQWIYLIPTLQNPTGTNLRDAQRRDIVQTAGEAGCTIIEDLSMADLLLNEESPAPLAMYAPDGVTLSIGSLSKAIWGGLRVGWVRASRAIIARLVRFKAIQDLGSPTLNQVMATHIFADLALLLGQRRRELRVRQACMEAYLAQWLPNWQWRHPAGGLFLWAQLPEGDARELAQIATRHGVLVTPGPTLSVDETHIDHLRLAYIRSPEELVIGLERLRRAWEEYTQKMGTRLQFPQVIV